FRLPAAVIPDHHLASTILAFRNRAFEFAVSQRMIFHLDGHAFDGRVEAGAFGDGPTLEGALEFQPKVVMQPPRPMLLNDEAGRGCFLAWGRSVLATGFPSFREIPLARVVTQGVRSGG